MSPKETEPKKRALPDGANTCAWTYAGIFRLAFAGCAVKVRPALDARAFDSARASGSQTALSHPWLRRKTTDIHVGRPSGLRTSSVINPGGGATADGNRNRDGGHSCSSFLRTQACFSAAELTIQRLWIASKVKCFRPEGRVHFF